MAVSPSLLRRRFFATARYSDPILSMRTLRGHDGKVNSSETIPDRGNPRRRAPRT
jgi:hypothetical protein